MKRLKHVSMMSVLILGFKWDGLEKVHRKKPTVMPKLAGKSLKKRNLLNLIVPSEHTEANPHLFLMSDLKILRIPPCVTG